MRGFRDRALPEPENFLGPRQPDSPKPCMSTPSSDSGNKPQALFLAAEAPYPTIGGGPIRAASVLEYLAAAIFRAWNLFPRTGSAPSRRRDSSRQGRSRRRYRSAVSFQGSARARPAQCCPSASQLPAVDGSLLRLRSSNRALSLRPKIPSRIHRAVLVRSLHPAGASPCQARDC